MQAIVILGMHRSGTSCLTGCLQQLGLHLGDVSDFNEYNLKGNKEDDSIARLNEKILNHNDGSWRSPPRENNWTLEHEDIRNTILKNYSKLPSPIGFKDPRMIFTLPFWQQVLPNIKLLGSFRHPLNVAQSLYARKNIRIEINQGLKLWSTYNLKLLSLQKQYGFDLVNFDQEPSEYLSQVFRKATKLNLEKSIDSLDFFDDTLRNQNTSISESKKCPDEVLNIYNELLNISKDLTITPINIGSSIKS